MGARSSFRHVLGPAAVVLAWAVLAHSSPAAQLPFSGTLSIAVAALPPVQVAGAGVATLEPQSAGLHLDRAVLPASVFANGGSSVAVSAPSAFPIAGLQVTASNGAGSFVRNGGGRLGGLMSIHGVAKVCLFSACNEGPLANVSLPVSVLGSGGAVTGIGAVNVTVVGAPWTTGTAAFGSLILGGGSAVGPAGRSSSTILPGGRLSLVTPVFISTNIGALAEISALGRVDIRFQDAPPLCEVAVNRSRYENGDALVISSARFASPRATAANVRLQLELVFPVNGGLVVSALDSNTTLPAGFDSNFGPVTAFTVSAEHPRGAYQLRCRISDSATGAELASNVAAFSLPFHGPSPFCDVAVSQDSYVDGEPLVATHVRFANPQSEDAAVHLRYELVLPIGGGLVHSVYDSDVTLPAGYDDDFGPATGFIVSKSFPRGAYQLRCGISDPISGAPVAEDVAAFSFQ